MTEAPEPRVGQTWHHRVFGVERTIVVVLNGSSVSLDRPMYLIAGDRSHPDMRRGSSWPLDEFLAKWWPS